MLFNPIKIPNSLTNIHWKSLFIGGVPANTVQHKYIFFLTKYDQKESFTDYEYQKYSNPDILHNYGVLFELYTRFQGLNKL